MNRFCTKAGHTEQYDSILGAAGSKSNQVRFAELQLLPALQEHQQLQLHLPITPHSMLTFIHAVKLLLFFSGPIFCLMDLNCCFFWLNSTEHFSAGESDDVRAFRYLTCKRESQGFCQVSPEFVQSHE